jgi:HPt (histidine-containing phosphotransfer) domain-containing protein
MDQLEDYRDGAGGTSELLLELGQIFRDDTAAYVLELRGAIARSHAEDVRRTAHSIKGSTTVIGARQTYAICVARRRESIG